MKAKLEAVKRRFDKILNWFAVILFLAVFLTVLLQVFMRFVINSPLVWSEELSRYLFMWICYIGWCFSARNGTHIRIGFVAERLPEPVQRAIDIINILLTLIFAGILFWFGIVMMRRNLQIRTVTLYITYAVVYASVPFGMIFFIFYNVYRLINGYKTTGGTLS
jgi:TRAP-type C4-dicarboxylate transport system permease small subunit